MRLPRCIGGKLDRAAEIYRELLDKLIASQPDPENDLMDATVLSRVYEAIARLSLQTGKSEQAKAASVSRLKLWESWSRKLPNNPFIRRELDAAPAS